MLITEPEGMLRMAHAKGLDAAAQRDAVCPMGEGISGRVAKTGEPLQIPDPSRALVRGRGELHPRYRTNILRCVSPRGNGKTTGVLNANKKVTGKPYDENDLTLFPNFSCLVSLSHASTQLFERLASLVGEQIRTNARRARVDTDLEARERELQALRGQRT